MKNYFLLIFLVFISCKNKTKNGFFLNYKSDENYINLYYINKTDKDLIFLVPNTLIFGDEKYKFSSSTFGTKEGDFPLTVYAEIIKNQENKFYQNKLDSVFNEYIVKNKLTINSKQENQNSVMLIKKDNKLSIKYKLFIRKNFGRDLYTSDFKQNYYQYDKVLKQNYANSDYIKQFAKINFLSASFVAQPIVEDSLILRISK